MASDINSLVSPPTPHPLSLPPRHAAAEKALEKMKAEGLIEKPFVPKRRSFLFPPVDKMGQTVLEVDGLTHGYNGRMLFKDAELVIEKGERVAILGPNG